MAFFFSWFRKKHKQKRGQTSIDSTTFDEGPEMDVSTEDLYSGSYFSVENELSYITNSSHNFMKSAKSYSSNHSNKSALKHQSINRSNNNNNNKTIDLSRRKENNNNNNNNQNHSSELYDDHSGDLWRVLME